jgi:hypothetical protein
MVKILQPLVACALLTLCLLTPKNIRSMEDEPTTHHDTADISPNYHEIIYDIIRPSVEAARKIDLYFDKDVVCYSEDCKTSTEIEIFNIHKALLDYIAILEDRFDAIEKFYVVHSYCYPVEHENVSTEPLFKDNSFTAVEAELRALQDNTPGLIKHIKFTLEHCEGWFPSANPDAYEKEPQKNLDQLENVNRWLMGGLLSRSGYERQDRIYSTKIWKWVMNAERTPTSAA